MSKEELLQSLQKLKTEIEALAGDDDSVKLKLATLVTDVICQVNAPNETGEEEENSFSEKVSDLVGDFETEHPQLSEAIYRVSMILSDLGI
ncbi:hypothetical protein MNBD_PLANCTO02-2480 [hydrothermal vent metagenome]|uniref:DUF4404 family protein n=1 Tax=hydrothermal vent metagenome TaxID=652676 RepID=A0A3B1E3T9_9ZZZZ